jgi:predicted MFS family arabinose efflux permease
LGLFIVSQKTPVMAVKLQDKFWSGMVKLLSNRNVILFFAITLVGGMGLAMIHHYLFMFLSHLGANSITMGLALTIATISELSIMYLSDRLLKLWKSRGLILFGLLMISLRLIGYSLVTAPIFVLLLQLLHGPTFGAIWMAGVAYVAEIAPPGLGNTAQGMFTGVVMGLGSALGALLGGFLYQSIGFSMMFLVTGVSVFTTVLVFRLGSRKMD